MKKNKKGCDLQSCMLCKLCIKEWLPAIAENRESFHFKKGEILFKEQDPVHGIYFVTSGTVKVHKHWTEGKELILRFARNGSIVGHRGLGKGNQFPVTATAIEPSNVCFVSLDFFLTTLKVNQSFLLELMLFYANELQESEENMRNMVHMQVKARIAKALLVLRDQFGTDASGCLDIPLSRHDLASYAGTAYETVFRILNDFVKEDIIRTDRNHIAILNEDYLASLTHVQ